MSTSNKSGRLGLRARVMLSGIAVLLVGILGAGGVAAEQPGVDGGQDR